VGRGDIRRWRWGRRSRRDIRRRGEERRKARRKSRLYQCLLHINDTCHPIVTSRTIGDPASRGPRTHPKMFCGIVTRTRYFVYEIGDTSSSMSRLLNKTLLMRNRYEIMLPYILTILSFKIRSVDNNTYLGRTIRSVT